MSLTRIQIAESVMDNIVDLRRITIFFVPVDLTFQFDAKR